MSLRSGTTHPLAVRNDSKTTHMLSGTILRVRPIQPNPLLAHQIQELIQFVSDEKDARESLQELAARLTGDLESLKHAQLTHTPAVGRKSLGIAHSSTPTSAQSDKSWGSRRLNKQAKYGRFEAQQWLDAEIRAKQQALEELRMTRTHCDEVEKELHDAKRKMKHQREDMERIDRENQELRRQLAAQQWLRPGGSEMPDVVEHTAQHRLNPAFFNMIGTAAAVGTPSEFSPYSTRSAHMSYGPDNEYESPVSRFSNAQHPPRAPASPTSLPSLTYENANRFYHAMTPSSASTLMACGRGAASPKVLNALNNALNGKGHRFTHASLRSPQKCGYCTSVLVGLDRQGMFCQDCQYFCHVNCVSKVPMECPVPEEQRRPLGIDPLKGVGTAYDGFVKTPTPKGVRKGWQPTYVVVCDFKLYLYDCHLDRQGKPANVEPHIRQVLDMRDPQFRVGKADATDAIHASKSDLPKIFKVMFSQIGAGSGYAAVGASDTMGSSGSGGSPAASDASVETQYALLMADTQEESRKWVTALNELKKILGRSGLSYKSAFLVKEVAEVTALPMLRSANCATIIDRAKFVIGFADQGLMCVELEQETMRYVGGESECKKRHVEKVEYDSEEQLLIGLVGAGKDRHVRLIPTAALDGKDVKWIKVCETKGCHLMCWGRGHSARHAPAGAPVDAHYFAAAVQKSVVIFQIDRSQTRHHKVRELAMPGQPQTLRISNGKLFVGYPSGFRMWDLIDNSQTSLVNLEDGSLQFLNQTLHDAQMIVDVSGEPEPREFLLVFQKFGIYVDSQGRRSRAQEVMFPCRPSTTNGFAFQRPHLCLYSDNQIDVFNVETAEWVQTVNLRKARPLHDEGALTLTYVLDAPYLVMLSALRATNDPLHVPQTAQQMSSKGVQKRRRKFSVRTKEDAGRAERRSVLPISGPSDFVHVVHMGPGHVVDLQNLIDVKSPTTSSSSLQGSQTEKVKQMMNPVMRSTSTSSSSAHRSSGSGKGDPRPVSSHSRSSNGSSLGKDGRLPTSTTMTTSVTTDASAENDYLEPISKKPSLPASNGNAAPPLPSTMPPTPATTSD
ncbi:AGC/DMPK/GEK protein kinase [Aphelenchoides avenae]|nr:AGC/DMPK/GEK protein kinase [Aphelenchus avenae]